MHYYTSLESFCGFSRDTIMYRRFILAVFYSVIIPFYNTEKYIDQCLRSVLEQSFQDYEIIVVNDGSTDASEQIVSRLAAQSPAVSVKRIGHSGAGAARNAGMEAARGEYVIFLDADDYWTNPYLLEHIHDKLQEHKADLVMFQMDKYTEDGKILKKYRKGAFPSGKACFRLDEVYETLVTDGQVLASSCNKCVRRGLLKNSDIRFQEGGLAEDIDWVLQLFSHVESISFLDEISYAYRQHQKGSASSNTAGAEYQARMVKDWAAKQKQKQKQGKAPNARAISGFLAFEYGICLGYWQYLSPEMKKMIRSHRYLLDYALDKKTKLIQRFCRIFGLRLTCLAVRFYLFLRRLYQLWMSAG